MSHKVAKKLRQVFRKNHAEAVEYVFGEVKRLKPWPRARVLWRLFDQSPLVTLRWPFIVRRHP